MRYSPLVRRAFRSMLVAALVAMPIGCDGGGDDDGDGTGTGDGGDDGSSDGGDAGGADDPAKLCEAIGWSDPVAPNEAFAALEGTFLMGTDVDCSTDTMSFLTATTYMVTVAPADRSITVTHEGGEATMAWDDREDLACDNDAIEGALIIRVAEDADHSFGVHNVERDAITVVVKDGSVVPGCKLIQQV